MFGRRRPIISPRKRCQDSSGKRGNQPAVASVWYSRVGSLLKHANLGDAKFGAVVGAVLGASIGFALAGILSAVIGAVAGALAGAVVGAFARVIGTPFQF